ncbi:hypothetical protein PHYPSEUDO_006870 [Phytophthora pseudosyringae]|uniref:Uncharacterized protein n=1 Tax=Phytophthora pseudosyringae TaxID=221518 RepID=A0A8T1WBW0_9STRA|nr:hypothetical protein PHYPSEUDO_006870 [Phytophthora pseudosyringae]
MQGQHSPYGYQQQSSSTPQQDSSPPPQVNFAECGTVEAMDPSELEEKAELIEERTETFPMELPMENRYLLPKYFVRIGTSVFYGYFFEHYKWKPKVTIITASFTIESRMQEDVVFRADGSVERSSRESHKVMDAARKAALERKDKVLYLYDGPPSFEPDIPSKMICFASPNEAWLRKVSKKLEACTLYMPLWGVEELVDAANSLQLEPEVTREKIEERFAIFGGVARGCLPNNEKFLSKRIEDLEKDIDGTDSLNIVRPISSACKGFGWHGIPKASE